jgi:hypothetical protein
MNCRFSRNVARGALACALMGTSASEVLAGPRYSAWGEPVPLGYGNQQVLRRFGSAHLEGWIESLLLRGPPEEVSVGTTSMWPGGPAGTIPGGRRKIWVRP